MTEYTNETLVDLIRNGDTKDRKEYLAILYEQNYLYIRKICKRYSVSEDIDDLTQEAFFGIRIAVDRYEPDQGVPFINYASIWIENVIRRYVYTCGTVIRIPNNMKRSIIKYQMTVKDFYKNHGREPLDQELRELLSLNDKQLDILKERAITEKVLSLDKTISTEDETFTLSDVVIDPEDHYEDITNQMDDEQKRRDVWEAVSTLDDRKADIIEKRYKDNMSLSQIGNALGLSKERIRQIENKALKQLSRSEKIKAYESEYLSARAYTGTGLSTFINTGTSAPERVAIERYEHDIAKHMKDIERTIRLMKDKYGIILGDEFRKEQLDKICGEKITNA